MSQWNQLFCTLYVHKDVWKANMAAAAPVKFTLSLLFYFCDAGNWSLSHMLARGDAVDQSVLSVMNFHSEWCSLRTTTTHAKNTYL